MMSANEQITTISGKRSRWERLARAGWYGCAAISLVVFILSIPAQLIPTEGELYRSLAAPAPSSLMKALEITNFLGRTAAALISLILASALFFKRPNDKMALFLSYFLFVFGIVIAGPLTSLESFWPGLSEIALNVVAPILFTPFLVTFLSVFPNGRFVPYQTRWLVVVSILFAPFSTILFKTQSAYSIAIGTLLSFGLIFTALYTQIYRYRHVSSPTERQQTKWVVYGFTLGLLIALLITIADLAEKRQALAFPSLLLSMLGRLGWPMAIVALPISLAIAVMRYHLYNIDILINRTLVYSALTASVVAIYALSVGALGVVFQTQGNLFIALLATGLVAVLFQPIRERLQRSVNHLVYGERDEPFTVLRHLGKRLESSGTPEEMLPAIVETVTQTLKLPYAEITLQQGDELELVALYGKASTEIIPFPIQYQGQLIGSLNVTPRSPGESLGESDKGLLRQIARQAGPVAYTFKLTQDLRQSHTRLVIARDEERRRLRRDLHDGLGPVLASQGLKVAAVSHLLYTDPKRARKLLDELASQNEATVAEIRRLVYALRPPELDELGLVGAVRDYAAGLNNSSTNSTIFQVKANSIGGELLDFPNAVEVAAYRITTEALTNVMRHAHAHHCTVSFQMEAPHNGRVLHLEIADDGVGLPNEGRAGIGLNSMRERAMEVGGDLCIESVPHQGTKIVAKFPLME